MVNYRELRYNTNARVKWIFWKESFQFVAGLNESGMMEEPSDRVIKSPFTPSEDFDSQNLVEALLDKCDQYYNSEQDYYTVTSDTGEKINYADVARFSKNLCCFLQRKGFKQNDVAIYLTINTTPLLTMMLGVWRANGVLRATYPEDDEDTLLERVEESRCGWIFCDESDAEKCLSVAEKVYWDVEVIIDGHSELLPVLSDIFETDIDDEATEFQNIESDICIILNTSGSTGLPKGAEISFGALKFQAKYLSKVGFIEQSPNLILSKATHVSAIVISLATFLFGFSMVVVKAVNSVNVLETIQEYKPEFGFGFPSILLGLVNDPAAENYDISSLKCLVSGGAAVTDAIKGILLQTGVEKVGAMYGLTEVGAVSAEIFEEDETQPLEKYPDLSIGRPFPEVEMKVVDQDTGAALGENENGELCIKTKGVFSQYLNNPEATKDAFLENEWFRTGDICYYNSDGCVCIVDRAKEIFKYWNNHISPSEIESILNSHDAVGEVCVIGVDDPEGGGHVPRAYAVIQEGFDISEEELMQYANDQLASYKHLRGGIIYLDSLPKGNTGKISRAELRALASSEND